MDEKEHPARTAGRYVRAAGVAIRKERERLAAESARRAAEAAQAEQQAPPPATTATPPPVAPPQAAPPRPAAPPQKQPRPARKPAEPPTPRPLIDRLLWWGFLITVVVTGLAALSIDTLFSGTAQMVFRLVLGSIFMAVSLTILTNWQRANERLVARLMKKFWGMDHPTTGSGRFMRRIAKDLMILLGILWLAMGVFEILRALVNT